MNLKNLFGIAAIVVTGALTSACSNNQYPHHYKKPKPKRHAQIGCPVPPPDPIVKIMEEERKKRRFAHEPNH